MAVFNHCPPSHPEYDNRIRQLPSPSKPTLPAGRLLDLRCPALDILAFRPHFDRQLDALHALCILHKRVVGHSARVRPVRRQQLQHGKQHLSDSYRFLNPEVVFFSQHVWQGPMSQAVNVSQLALAVEDLL